MENLWNIKLEPWVIEDGNYDDFRTGQIARFALEFHASDVERIKPTAGKSCQPRGDGYLIEGEVRARFPDAWTIEFGIAAYQNQPPPKHIAAGDNIKALIELFVDPYFYFEQLSMQEGMPDLIYTWSIEQITMLSAPLVLGNVPHVGKCWVPDKDQEARQIVPSTDVVPPGFDFIREEIREGLASLRPTHSVAFLLQCRRLNIPLRRYLTETTIRNG